jgi:hypothetical protein
MKQLGFACMVLTMMAIVFVAHKESEAGAVHRLEVAPLKVTMYLGTDCLVNGQFQDMVLTNDDADFALQHCEKVTWKELRRE